jgi:hypothetical protein
MGTLQRATIRARGVIAAAATIILTGAPFAVQAVPISPNPNPEGSIINIVNDPYAVDTANPFYNAGAINIDSASILTNAAGAQIRFDDGGTLNNAGRLDNYGSMYGLGAQPHVLNNTGTLNNFARAAMEVHLVNAVGATTRTSTSRAAS